MVAAEEREETAGSDAYQDNHMAAIFKEGFSFSGYERDLLALNRGDGTYLNISGVTAMLDHFLPALIERGSGRVLNVASIAAFQPVPGMATYAASKAYVLSLTESLSEELKGTGVTITALCPGVTATNMVSTVQEQSGGLSIPDFAIGDVDDVAAQGFKACMKGEVICVPGAINLATTLAGRATPKWLLRRVSGIVGRYTSGS